MRIVLQRVARAQVRIDGSICGSIGPGLLLLLGIHHDDTPECADALVDKCCDLRIFADEAGKMNRSLTDIAGAALIVSQFTLYGDCRKGRRPSFTQAAPPDKGRALYDYFVARFKSRISNVQTGVFGAMMEVELVNDGPVTFVLEQ